MGLILWITYLFLSGEGPEAPHGHTQQPEELPLFLWTFTYLDEESTQGNKSTRKSVRASQRSVTVH